MAPTVVGRPSGIAHTVTALTVVCRPPGTAPIVVGRPPGDGTHLRA
ncbi:hypothetical protein COLO4_00058 [Corchorus olitorius]|uniref:Uncharacterized protein n=1 Tax=Corchorus olitorius TaxID=93759 RepID=A0A1R3L4W1_9ROSI|nr:hypothetical protein COLO4_00058 [Corchorus olitorius]